MASVASPEAASADDGAGHGDRPDPPRTGTRWRYRWRRRLLGTVVVLMVAFFGGGGWYFASLIGSGALDVAPYEPEYRLTVISVDAASITLDDSQAVWEDIRNDRTLALRWPAGFGLISGPPSVPGSGNDTGAGSGPIDRVTRAFELTDGTLPRVGDELALTRDMIDDPAMDPAVKLVTYSAPGGEYPAWFVDAAEPGAARQGAVGEAGDSWAILVHGKGGTPAEMWRMSLATRDAGMSTLMITYRNDTGATEDPSGRYQYGRTEWRDLAAAVEYARSQGATRIVLGGASMGGGVVAAYLRNTPAEQAGVVGVVLDAPMLDLGRTIDWGAAQQPLRPPRVLTAAAKQIASWRYDVDFRAVNYIDDPGWDSVPTLILHTAEDKTVPVTSSRDFVLGSEQATLEEFAGEHVESYNDDPLRYLETIGAFLSGLGDAETTAP